MHIHLRPHHGICLLNFIGKGYSDDFSLNMSRMQQRLMENPKLLITITKGADDLCTRCPHRVDKDCSSLHPPLFDENVLRLTGLSYGQSLTWEEFSSLTSPLSLYRLEKTCPGCEWFSLCKEIAAGRQA